MTKTASSLMTAVIFIFGLAYSSSSIAYDTSAKHAFLIDFDTNQVLFEKNADVLMPPASMSKIRLFGFALSRFARRHPAEPAPITI